MSTIRDDIRVAVAMVREAQIAYAKDPHNKDKRKAFYDAIELREGVKHDYLKQLREAREATRTL